MAESANREVFEVKGRKVVRRVPNPARTAKGLGKLTYTFEQSIAELIDNSITAGATKIEIHFALRITKKVYVHVLDNGQGIAPLDLEEAIAYGSSLGKSGASLSIYGFGMKTAMQSFTTKFYLTSKTVDSEYGMIEFDQDFIEDENDFIYPIDEPKPAYIKLIKEFSNGGSGTLIVTEDANGFFPIDEPEDKRLRFIKQSESILKKHIAMTYQRFLDPNDKRATNIQITVNDESIEAWDPFCTSEGLEPEKTTPLVLRSPAGQEGTLILRAFILPKEEEFSSREAYKRADVGPSTHGFYVYRENRLLDHATYFDIVRRDTHYQLLRIEMSYEAALDGVFNPALNKNRAFLGPLRGSIEEWLGPLLREANRRSRERIIDRPTKGIHDPSQKKIGSVSGSIERAKITPIDDSTVKVENNYGTVELPIKSEKVDSNEKIYIYPVESLSSGLLWEIRLINGNEAVALNKSHEFYQRFYLNSQGAAAYAVDAILWALAITEARCTIKDYRDQLEDFRYEVSRSLHKLAQKMPEVSPGGELVEPDEQY